MVGTEGRGGWGATDDILVEICLPSLRSPELQEEADGAGWRGGSQREGNQ